MAASPPVPSTVSLSVQFMDVMDGRVAKGNSSFSLGQGLPSPECRKVPTPRPVEVVGFGSQSLGLTSPFSVREGSLGQGSFHPGALRKVAPPPSN